MSVAIDILLWGIVAALALAAGARSRALLHEGVREGIVDFLALIPRMVLGVVGAGFLAEVLPQQLIVSWLGPNSGLTGVAIATLIGGLTPGGPVVGFAIGATALKSGAGAPQVIAFVTAWSLYAIQRFVMWEIPVMAPRVVWLRALGSLPLPFLAALGAMLVGRP
ncbi:MAG TPA: hypothetical protein VFQ90_06305 [Stellaceae bacterium]|jgi:uncharacterized membrane protein YraQ (UPF0718 family)|nr:hypothetical protein [Stellaceae bacterium]